MAVQPRAAAVGHAHRLAGEHLRRLVRREPPDERLPAVDAELVPRGRGGVRGPCSRHAITRSASPLRTSTSTATARPAGTDFAGRRPRSPRAGTSGRVGPPSSGRRPRRGQLAVDKEPTPLVVVERVAVDDVACCHLRARGLGIVAASTAAAGEARGRQGGRQDSGRRDMSVSVPRVDPMRTQAVGTSTATRRPPMTPRAVRRLVCGKTRPRRAGCRPRRPGRRPRARPRSRRLRGGQCRSRRRRR